MKNVYLLIFAIALLFFSSCKNEKSEAETTEAQPTAESTQGASTFKVDTSNSKIEWTGSKPTGEHKGTIALKSGELSFNNGNIESGKFTIDMNSIVVTDLKEDEGKTDLENHLKGTGDKEGEDHFFNVKKYPEASFEITKVTPKEGKTTIEGNLTLKGQTKGVSFSASISIEGNKISLNSDEFAINRTEWGITYSSKTLAGTAKDKFINDDIKLKINLLAVK